jgi:hypothetical protein
VTTKGEDDPKSGNVDGGATADRLERAAQRRDIPMAKSCFGHFSWIGVQ